MTKKKLTLKELIQNKEKFDRKSKGKKRQELYVEKLDATITIEEPDHATVVDSIELSNDENFEGNADDYLTYNTVVEPNLKDSELQKAYGCVEPMDVVSKIFDPGTSSSIAKAGMNLAGYNSTVTVVDDLKN